MQFANFSMMMEKTTDCGPSGWDFFEEIDSSTSGEARDSLYSDPHFKALVRQGIPPDLRRKVWQLMSGSEDLLVKNPGVYSTLLQLNSNCDEKIRLDINRTFPSHPFFKSKSTGTISLYNVLKVYSIFNQAVGYCQGMNYITAILLLYLEEEEAFWMLVQMMKGYSLQELFLPGLPGLEAHLDAFERLFIQRLPKLHKHLQQNEVSSRMYASKWVLTLFACRCTPEVSARIFDWFLVDRWRAILEVGIVVLVECEERLLESNFEDALTLLESAPETIEVECLLNGGSKVMKSMSRPTL